MNGTLTGRMTDIESKTNEAKAYHSMGLFRESLNVYQQILSGFPELTEPDQKAVSKRIALLKNKIARKEGPSPEQVEAKRS